MISGSFIVGSRTGLVTMSVHVGTANVLPNVVVTAILLGLSVTTTNPTYSYKIFRMT